MTKGRCEEGKKGRKGEREEERGRFLISDDEAAVAKMSSLRRRLRALVMVMMTQFPLFSLFNAHAHPERKRKSGND